MAALTPETLFRITTLAQWARIHHAQALHWRVEHSWVSTRPTLSTTTTSSTSSVRAAVWPESISAAILTRRLSLITACIKQLLGPAARIAIQVFTLKPEALRLLPE